MKDKKNCKIILNCSTKYIVHSVNCDYYPETSIYHRIKQVTVNVIRNQDFQKKKKVQIKNCRFFYVSSLKLNLNLEIPVESMVYFVLSKQKMFSLLPFSEKA